MLDNSVDRSPAGPFRPPVSPACFLLLCVAALPLSGCGWAVKYRSPERQQQGYVIVLPGIEGASYLNANICRGLVSGKVPSTIEVYDWTNTVLLFAMNLRDYARNQQEARKIARKIVEYQSSYPGRPVHLIGHSGGGGIAVMTLEALPPNRQIASAILLAPAIAPDYDLRRALARTEFGIWNYYSPYDVGFLRAGTMLMGTIEGRHTSAAGAVGFSAPRTLNAEGRALYASKLYQQQYNSKMLESGHTGGHTGWAFPKFVSDWLAPLINAQIQARARAGTLPRAPAPAPRAG